MSIVYLIELLSFILSVRRGERYMITRTKYNPKKSREMADALGGERLYHAPDDSPKPSFITGDVALSIR